MNIAFVCPRYWPYRGGVERYVQEIATRLTSSNEVEVLTTDPHGDLSAYEEVQGVLVKRFKSWAPSDSIYNSGDMFAYLLRRSGSYDIVHANSYHALPAYYAAESKSRNKLVFTPHFHGTIGHSRFRTFMHIAYRLIGLKIFERADRVIYSTRFEGGKILQSFKVPVSKLVRIQEGITSIPHMSKLRYENRKMILCVSRFERYKGIQHIIKALPYLPKIFNLTLVGSGSHGTDLRKLVQRLGLQERVVFMHDIAEHVLNRLYGEADVAVLLSEHEAHSLFIGEALSAGIPCVVANRSALKEWVDGESCVGVDDTENPRAVVEAILRVIGRKVSRSLPNWNDYVISLTDLYLDVLRD